MRSLFIMLTLCLLCGCGAHTKARYDKFITENWEGKSIEDLILEWGPPTDAFDTDKGMTVYYKTSHCKTTFSAGPDKIIYSHFFQGVGGHVCRSGWSH